jgi:hypothetical protein
MVDFADTEIEAAKGAEYKDAMAKKWARITKHRRRIRTEWKKVSRRRDVG